jgi:Metallopeptidase family M24
LITGMREAAPGKYKYEVEAAIEHVYLKSGAMSWGYPSIVGSGPNATILHYNKSNRKIKPGDLLLVDAAANGVSHWIGMEVHDFAVPRPLGSGMTFVIEPGIYIREAALDNLPKTPENAAFIDKVRPAVQNYRNIGMRIGDSFCSRTPVSNGSRPACRARLKRSSVFSRASSYLSASPAARLAFFRASSASSTSFRAASCSCASFAFLKTSIALSTAHCSAIDVAATVMPCAFEKAA